ncbi:MAG: PQQ-dependent sugar dehydrogenase [Myxococcales bacterium]
MGRSLRLALCSSVLAFLTLPRAAAATVVDPAFTETLFSPTMTHVTGIVWATDGSNRLFYGRKNGQVWVIQDGVIQPMFASLSPITTSSECGLIGIALDPGFATNHFVYVFVTKTALEQQIIRFKDVNNVGTEPTVIMSGLPTRGANHDGGGIGFGPDGNLYWSIGDNGNHTGAGDDLISLASKVGRATRDGGVPGDNPFADGDGPNNDYIWARGFRNPFTLTFSPVTGALWVNVTGLTYEQVFVVHPGDNAGWFSYETIQPAGYIRPVISYRTNAVDVRPIATITRQGGVATVTCSLTHRVLVGAKVTLADIADASFNGEAYVTGTPSDTVFTIAQPGTAASSTGGTVTTATIGGALTGGTFWDSSALPVDQQGSFLFGDYNSGRVMRAKLNATGTAVTAIDEFANGVADAVDMDVGPDGALYYASNTGEIYRASYNFSGQALRVSRLHVRMPEGGATGFAVSLAVAPPQPRTVKVQWKSGDADVSVASGATLAFDATNWSVPQPVLLAAAQDDDSSEDLATVSVSSNGLKTQLVAAQVTDDDALAIVVSQPELAMVEGGSAALGVSLNGPPAQPLTVKLSLSGDPGLTLDPSSLVFDSQNWSVPQPVTVSAAQDEDALDTIATLTVAAPGLGTRPVSVSVDDDDDSAPSFTSVPSLVAVVGVPYVYDAKADGLPTPSFSLERAPSGMTVDAVSGHVAWLPGRPATVGVELRATNGVPDDARQAFEIEVKADEAPQCALTAPKDGDVLSGEMAQFFGHVEDDVGAVGAVFSIDGDDRYTDQRSDDVYYFGGADSAFDTRDLEDGPHVLRMTGQDTSGQTCFAEVTISVENHDGEEAAAGAGGGVGKGGAGPDAPGGNPDGGVAGADAGEGGDAGKAAGVTQGGGCDCRVPRGEPAAAHGALLALLGLAMFGARRRPTTQGRLDA